MTPSRWSFEAGSSLLGKAVWWKSPPLAQVGSLVGCAHDQQRPQDSDVHAGSVERMCYSVDDHGMCCDDERERDMKLSTVRVLVGDFPAAFAFWRDVVHLPPAYGPGTPRALPNYAYFTAGDVGLELMTRDGFATALGMPAPASAPTDPRMVVTLKVDDVDATYADLVA